MSPAPLLAGYGTETLVPFRAEYANAPGAPRMMAMAFSDYASVKIAPGLVFENFTVKVSPVASEIGEP